MQSVAINPKLMALPIEALFKLKAEINEVAARRKYEAFKIGSFVSFDDKSGAPQIGRIEKMGPKNLSVVVMDARGFPLPGHQRGSKWRMHPNYCQPVFGNPFAKPDPVPLRTAKDTPTAAVAHW